MNLSVSHPFAFPSLISFRPSLGEPRRLGPTGSELRQAVERAFEHVRQRLEIEILYNRAPEIRSRLLDAAHQAQNDGILVLPDVFGNALALMESLPAELPLPDVVVESRDTMGLDWDNGPGRVVSLTIYASNQIGFSALIGRKAEYGRVDYVHEFYQPLLGKIQSLLQSVCPSAFA